MKTMHALSLWREISLAGIAILLSCAASANDVTPLDTKRIFLSGSDCQQSVCDGKMIVKTLIQFDQDMQQLLATPVAEPGFADTAREFSKTLDQLVWFQRHETREYLPLSAPKSIFDAPFDVWGNRDALSLLADHLAKNPSLDGTGAVIAGKIIAAGAQSTAACAELTGSYPLTIAALGCPAPGTRVIKPKPEPRRFTSVAGSTLPDPAGDGQTLSAPLETLIQRSDPGLALALDQRNSSRSSLKIKGEARNNIESTATANGSYTIYPFIGFNVDLPQAYIKDGSSRTPNTPEWMDAGLGIDYLNNWLGNDARGKPASLARARVDLFQSQAYSESMNYVNPNISFTRYFVLTNSESALLAPSIGYSYWYQIGSWQPDASQLPPVSGDAGNFPPGYAYGRIDAAGYVCGAPILKSLCNNPQWHMARDKLTLIGNIGWASNSGGQFWKLGLNWQLNRRIALAIARTGGFNPLLDYGLLHSKLNETTVSFKFE